MEKKRLNVEVPITPEDINRVLNGLYGKKTAFDDMMGPYEWSVGTEPMWGNVADEIKALGNYAIERALRIDNVEVPVTREQVMAAVYGRSTYRFSVPFDDMSEYIRLALPEAEGIWKIAVYNGSLWGAVRETD